MGAAAGALLLAIPVAGRAALGVDQFVDVGPLDPSPPPFIETWGASWGDMDGDGDPDLWLGKHQFTPSVLLRNDSGAFSEVFAELVPAATAEDEIDDTHGAAWADFDGDGDEDLLELSGGGAGAASGGGTILERWRNNLYVSDGGIFIEDAVALGIDYPRARSRTPLWLDYDADGALDAVVAAVRSTPEQFPAAIFRQTAAGFVDTSAAVGFDAGSCAYAMLSHLTGDLAPTLVCGDSSRIGGIYDISTDPFTKLGADAIGGDLFAAFPWDLAIADFDGDQRFDIFASIVPQGPSTAVRIRDAEGDRIHAGMAPASAERGFSFTAPGAVVLEFGWETARGDIRLGAGAAAPPVDSDPGLRQPDTMPHHIRLTLSPSDPALQGLPASRTQGIYIGYVGGAWEVRVANAGKTVNLVAQADGISQPVAIGATSTDQGLRYPPMVFRSRDGKLERQTVAEAFADPQSEIESYGTSVVAGDFDNDGDVDVYLGATGTVANVANKLFDNLGDGRFKVVEGAGGAAGTLLGKTDTVAVADYDQDGFLDLFVTQGAYPAPFSYSGRHQLFRNRGNGNHWIQIDLEGVISNPHGIGALIYARTPDGRVQLREQSNGTHRYAQSHRRIHFGLGQNATVDLEVHWPSGIVDAFTGVASDRILRLTEGGGGEGPGEPACGAPSYDAATDRALFVWRDCETDNWHVRITGGGISPSVEHTGSVVSSQPFASVSRVYLEENDVLDTAVPGTIGFALRAGEVYQDGFDFALAPGANACFTLSAPADLPVLAGAERVPVGARVALPGFGACADDPPVNPTCGAPSYDKAADGALFLWQDCGSDDWHVRIAGGGRASVSHEGSVVSAAPFAGVTAYALEDNDRLDSATPGLIAFALRAGLVYQDGFDFALSPGAQACFSLDTPAGLPVLAGAERVAVGARVALPGFGTCQF